MSVNVVIPWNFLHLTNDTKEMKIEGTTVGDCLKGLIQKYPGLRPDLFDSEGTLKNDIIIYVNNKTTYPEQLANPVEDGDDLNISVLIGGG